MRARLLAGVTACLVLAACGGGGGERLSKPDYEQKVRAVYASVQDAFRSTRASSGDLGMSVERAQRRLREAADELEASEPPEEVEEENEDLAEGMREYAKDLERLRDAAERGDAEAIARFNDEVGENAAIERMAEAAEEMKLKGYDLGALLED